MDTVSSGTNLKRQTTPVTNERRCVKRLHLTSYFWMRHWIGYVDEQMARVRAMWPDEWLNEDN